MAQIGFRVYIIEAVYLRHSDQIRFANRQEQIDKIRCARRDRLQRSSVTQCNRCVSSKRSLSGSTRGQELSDHSKAMSIKKKKPETERERKRP